MFTGPESRNTELKRFAAARDNCAGSTKSGARAGKSSDNTAGFSVGFSCDSALRYSLSPCAIRRESSPNSVVT